MRVAQYTATLHALLECAERAGVFVIGRVQDVRTRGVVVNNGELERIAGGQAAGIGVHVFTRDGLIGFASSDRIAEDEAQRLVRIATQLAKGSERLDPERNTAVFDLAGAGVSVVPTTARRLSEVSSSQQSQALLDANRETMELATGFTVRSSYGVAEEEWRIVRSDGADVSFCTPHASTRHEITTRTADGVASGGCAVSGSDARVLLDDAYVTRLRRRTRAAVRRARAVVDAPRVQSGSYQLVLDHALAKGLAHEAFGHASETDGAETSILATGGRLRLGERVARAGVSVIDGPIEGDYAFQPISANGLPRQTVHVIRDGVLESGLGDLFSAQRAGSSVTGACRAESYRSQPLPRMSNIRIEVAGASSPEMDSDELLPEELRDLLRREGLMSAGERILYLSGYRGGQVNPKLGDFVFNCGAIFDLSDGASARQPAVFSGRSLSALRSIRAGLGPLILDAMGHCGKGGQSVPSSGGSHAFLLLEAHPDVVIGGGR